MRVKMFFYEDYRELDKQVNLWLSKNAGNEIVHVTQSQDAGTEATCGTALITIWYEVR